MKEQIKRINLAYNLTYIFLNYTFQNLCRVSSYTNFADISTLIIRKGNYFWYFDNINLVKVVPGCIEHSFYLFWAKKIYSDFQIFWIFWSYSEISNILAYFRQNKSLLFFQFSLMK